MIYVGALICSTELGSSSNPDLVATFGSLYVSMYSHFKLMTLEAWPDICQWAMDEHPLWALYFIFYIVITNLALVNLVTGLITDGIVQEGSTEDWSSEMKIVEAEPFAVTLREIVVSQGID